MLRETVAASAVIAAISVIGFAIGGQMPLGIGLGVGLLIGSLNGHLIAMLLVREAPFVAASVGRMALVSAVAVLAALMLGSTPWSVLIGVAVAQAVMVAAAVRQGLRT
jgi:hypothetical protein